MKYKQKVAAIAQDDETLIRAALQKADLKFSFELIYGGDHCAVMSAPAFRILMEEENLLRHTRYITGIKVSHVQQIVLERMLLAGRLDLFSIGIEDTRNVKTEVVSRCLCQIIAADACEEYKLELVQKTVRFALGEAVLPPAVLMRAIDENAISIVDYLVSIGANIHQDGELCLRLAARQDYMDLAHHLITRYGADLEIAHKVEASFGQIDSAQVLNTKVRALLPADYKHPDTVESLRKRVDELEEMVRDLTRDMRALKEPTVIQKPKIEGQAP